MKKKMAQVLCYATRVVLNRGSVSLNRSNGRGTDTLLPLNQSVVGNCVVFLRQ